MKLLFIQPLILKTWEASKETALHKLTVKVRGIYEVGNFSLGLFK